MTVLASTATTSTTAMKPNLKAIRSSTTSTSTLKTSGASTSSSVMPLSTDDIPDVLDWPHRPVMVQAGQDTEILGLQPGQPVPLGVPFDFESPLFKGKMLLRFKTAPSDDVVGHETYFAGRKRLMQTVVQGQFKPQAKNGSAQPLAMSDLWAGSIFDQALAQAPPPYFTKIMDAVIRRVAPGVILDLASNQPKVIALYAGTAQTMSIDTPGNEPDITKEDIPENFWIANPQEDNNINLNKKLNTAAKRKKYLSNPKKAAKLHFDTDHVYTFHSYDDAMDYGRGNMRIPYYGDYDIKPAIGAQPLSLTAVTTQGETLYSFRIWHEETVNGSILNKQSSHLTVDGAAAASGQSQ